MPRNRMVRPEFWVSDQLVTCSRDARLLFIGLQCQADDAGVLPASCISLKMAVFPGDDCSAIDIKGWVNELIACELIREYAVANKPYWLVIGWKDYQKIEKPTYRYPLPEGEQKLITDSTTSSRGLPDYSDSARLPLYTKRREEKGREEKEEEIVVSGADSPIPKASQNCPQEEIKALYHEVLPMCRQIRVWNEERARLLRCRWKESEKHQSLNFWRWYFEHVKESKFLTGQVAGRDGKPPFLASLEWLIKPTNFAKIIEGNYHE